MSKAVRLPSGWRHRATRRAAMEFAGLVAAGRVSLPVKARFPLDRVQDAYRAIGAPGLGKVVLDIDTDGA